MNQTYELYHHGILGQKWGVRRFQNSDGSLTNAGRSRYSVSDALSNAKVDALDKLNRKGLLDFMDSKASDPFSATRSSDYRSSSSVDPLKFISNFSRYTDYARPANQKKDTLLDTYGNMRRRDSDQAKLDKALDKANSIFDPLDWTKSLIDKNGQSVADKKLGMLSKDARDIERAAAGKEFVDKLKSSNESVSDLVGRWYKTDFKGNQPAFTGKTYETMDVKQAKSHVWEPIFDSYGKEIGSQMKVTSWDTVKMADISRPTKEFIDHQKSLVMPESYSHLNSSYNKTFEENTGSTLDKYFSHDLLMSYNYLEHHGIKGQKWGNRKFQNSDGSLTPLGRVHYGVGAARNAAGKAASSVGNVLKSGASKTGKALRKSVAPTDADLDEKLQKAKAKDERRQKKEQIDELNGKKKKIKDMSDQEIYDLINRYKKERELKQAARDAGKSDARLYLENKMKQSAADALAETGKKMLLNIGQNFVDVADTKANKAQRKATMAKNLVEEFENKKKLKNLQEGKKDRHEEIKQRATDMENIRKAQKAELETRALAGDKRARKRLSDFANASKGKTNGSNKSNDQNNSNSNNQNKSNKINDSSKPNIFVNNRDRTSYYNQYGKGASSTSNSLDKANTNKASLLSRYDKGTASKSSERNSSNAFINANSNRTLNSNQYDKGLSSTSNSFIRANSNTTLLSNPYGKGNSSKSKKSKKK